MYEINLKDLYDGNFYHVCTDGLEQVTLLKDDEDFKVAWNYLALSAWRTEVMVVAFILMSNHVHLVLREGKQPLDTIMRRESMSRGHKNTENRPRVFYLCDRHLYPGRYSILRPGGLLQ